MDQLPIPLVGTGQPGQLNVHQEASLQRLNASLQGPNTGSQGLMFDSEHCQRRRHRWQLAPCLQPLNASLQGLSTVRITGDGIAGDPLFVGVAIAPYCTLLQLISPSIRSQLAGRRRSPSLSLSSKAFNPFPAGSLQPLPSLAHSWRGGAAAPPCPTPPSPSRTAR